jgi:hypothetical protein
MAMQDEYLVQAEEMFARVSKTIEAVKDKSSDTASLAIILAAVEETKKVVDPTSAIGRILTAKLIRMAAWKVRGPLDGYLLPHAKNLDKQE